MISLSRLLAFAVWIVGPQIAWFRYMVKASQMEVDPSVRGAYCWLYALGAPVVGLTSLLVYWLCFDRQSPPRS